MNTIKPTFASSVDPTEISLFVKGMSVLVLSIVGYFATKQGYDPMTATTQAQALIDLVVSAIPQITGVISIGVAAYGLVRKMFVEKPVDAHTA